MMGRWSGMVLAALAVSCLTQSIAEADDESHCAMQVGIRRKPVSDFGDDVTSEPADAGFESESPIPEESPAEEPAAEEAAAEEPADEESADEEPVAEEETTTEESEQDPAVKQSSAAGVYSDAPVLVGAKKKSGGHAGKSGGSSGGHAGKSGASSGGHAGHGTWAQAHKKGSTGSALGKEASGKFASEKAEKSTPKAGKWAGKWASKSTHGKDWKSAQGAGDSDFTTVMIDRFLNKKAPPKNEAVSEHAPLVFMHQHRAGGTTMRKLLYNMSVNMNLKPHIMCSGGVSCREFKNKDDKAAVYGGQFCWRELMESLPEKRVSCLTSFREPLSRIQSCYTNRLVHTKKIAPACMGKLEPSKLKSLLQNYGCVNEPFRRLGHCGLKPSDVKDKKARMLSWNTTLEHLAECVPVLVDKQETYGAAVKYFPQFKQVFWQMKKLKLNENQYSQDCVIPETHTAVIKELAAEELLLYEAAHKRAVNLNKHAG